MKNCLPLALTLGLMIACPAWSAEPSATQTLATVSYRRAPCFYNGEHVTGVWDVHPDDVVTTGGGRAYVTAQYGDSTRASAQPNSKVVFHPHWLEVVQGGIDIDLVSGTPHIEQIETPLGIATLKATTGSLTMPPPPAEDVRGRVVPWNLSIKATYGEFRFQLARPKGATSPPISLIVDAGDTVHAVISDEGRAVSLYPTTGDVVVEIGDSTQVKFPAKSRGDLRYLPNKKSLEVSCLRDALHITDATGKAIEVAGETSQTVAVADTWSAATLLKSRRGEVIPVATASTTTDSPSTEPSPPAYSGKLPQDHPYQRVLRDYLASLTEADLDPGELELTVAPPDPDPEAQYRMWLLDLDRVPRIGRKRSAPSVSAPARLFLLKNIEGPESIMRPPSWPEPLTWFANWEYAGNPYHGSQPLKRRAFVTAATLLMLLDHLHETAPETGVCSTDSTAHHLVLFAYTLPGVRSAIPAEVQTAFETGLRKMVHRVLAWGPSNHDVAMDLAAAVGLYYAGETLADDSLRDQAKTFARGLFKQSEHFHPAGYFVSNGGYDAAYNGQARFYAVWLALASGYEFAREPIAQAYRLRAHLSLPEPDGTVTGPCHFNFRTSRDASHDQYEWPFRDYGAAMLTDEAAHLTKLPSRELLASAGELRVQEFVRQIKENPGYAKPEEIVASPWSFRPWPNSWSFPQPINYAQEHYLAGSYARRAQLEAVQSPLLKLPVLRSGAFFRSFAQAFTVAKQDTYAAVLHTGPVASPGSAGPPNFAGPYGLGGGQLSAFWTPSTGAVILGRRGGMNSEQSFDRLDQWQTWPQHAVSGTAYNGRVFTTGRIQQLEVQQQAGAVEGQGTVRVSGEIPTRMLNQGRVLYAPLSYQRTFVLEPQHVEVETRLTAAGRDKLNELVETIPVYLREMQSQRKQLPTKIEFLVNDNWEPATATYKSGITAVRLTRFSGQVQVDFDRPRRVKLSAADWHDTYMSRASCRNIVVDLLENQDRPAVFDEASLRYSLRAL